MKWIGFFSLFASMAFGSVSQSDSYIESNGVKIFCKMMGKGEPLLILHGGPGLSHDYLLPQLGKLAETRQLVFYDQRGGGRSEGGDDPKYLNIDTFVEDLEAVRKHFGLKKLQILGHSWGGLLAMNYAAAYPNSVDLLILLHPCPITSEDYALFQQEYNHRIKFLSDELVAIQASKGFIEGNPEVVSDFLKKVLSVYLADPKKVDEIHLSLPRAAALGFIKITEAFDSTLFANFFDFREKLKTIRCKTFIVHGDKDLIPLKAEEHARDSIRGSKLVVIKDCGHFSYVEQPKELFFILDEFFQEAK